MARRVTKKAAAAKSRRAANKKLDRSVVRQVSRQSNPTGTSIETRGGRVNYQGGADSLYRADGRPRSMPEPRHSAPRKRGSRRKPAIELGNR